MRLARKLTIALTCAILIVLGGNSIVRVNREVELFEENSRADNQLLGRAVAGAVALIWQRVGESEALDLVEDANQRESQVQIRWVWLDAEPGVEHTPELPVQTLVPLMRGETLVRKTVPPTGGDEAVYTYVPVRLPGRRHGAVELRESLAAEHAYLRRTIVQASITTAILVLLCAAIMVGLGAVLVGRPVRALVEHARRIGAGDLSSKIDLRQRDEVGDLAAEMNAMSDRILEARRQLDAEAAAKVAAVEQLRHADRLTTVGKLAAGIAHEVGTPLNVIIGYSRLVADEYPPGSTAHDNAVIVAQQANRVTGIIRQLLDFARPRLPQRVPQDLAPIVKQVAVLLESLARKRGASIEVASPVEGISALVDASQLQQVIMNLVVNAIHATPTGGTITMGLERGHAHPPANIGRHAGGFACVYVADRGPGIPPDVLPRIFEPFYTTKDTGEGTGLGPSVAYGIVKEHGGWIGVDTTLEVGTRFSVYLPSERV